MKIIWTKPILENLTEEIFSEMPITNYKTIGDFSKRYSLKSKIDRELVTHPKAVEKITRQWEKTKFDFDIFVINDKRTQGQEFVEIGEVLEDFLYNEMKLKPEEFSLNPDAITIFFTNNQASERVPLNGWTMAHRLGHALRMSRTSEMREAYQNFIRHLEKQFVDILKDVYGINLKSLSGSERDKILKYAAQQIGTMKSARDSNLRNWGEFAHELLAQYLISGEIRFNPLPEQMLVGFRGWGHKNLAKANKEELAVKDPKTLSYYASDLELYIEEILYLAVGRIFVM